MTTTTTTRPRFYALDGLRGLAAFSILLFHVRETTAEHWLAPHGYLAVDFFFVLSGFVIAHAYGAALESRAIAPARFFVLRFARLWPSAALGTILGVVPVLLGQVPVAFSSLPLYVGLGLLMVPAFGTGFQFFPLNPPHWSLFDELAANAVYGLLARRIRFAALVALTVAAGAGTVALLFVTEGTQWAGPQRVVYPYLAGTLAYMLRARGVRSRSRALSWTSAAATLLVFWIPEAVGAREAAIFSAAVVVLFPLTVWAGAELETPRAIRTAAAIAGDASYPLYALHYPLLLMAWSAGASIPATILLVVIVALLAGEFYDAPLRRFLLRPIRRGRLGPTTATPAFGTTMQARETETVR